LERIDLSGSISAAARDMGMSYRQAWLLIDTMNAGFGGRVIDTSQGGRSGGGAQLTALGKQIVTRYRAMQRKIAQSTRDDLNALGKLIARQSQHRR
jgi:molybdate transport system regulatory protein